MLVILVIESIVLLIDKLPKMSPRSVSGVVVDVVVGPERRRLHVAASSFPDSGQLRLGSEVDQPADVRFGVQRFVLERTQSGKSQRDLCLDSSI